MAVRYDSGGGVYTLARSQGSWSYDFLYNFHGSPDGYYALC